MTALEPRKNICGTRRKQGIPCRLLLVLGALVASCSGERQPGIYQDGQPVRPFTSTENNYYQVRWASQPHPIPINEPFEIVLDVLGPGTAGREEPRQVAETWGGSCPESPSEPGPFLLPCEHACSDPRLAP